MNQYAQERGTRIAWARRLFMVNAVHLQIDIQRQSRSLSSHLEIFRRLNGPRRVGAMLSVLIIGLGQIWTCLRKHTELMRTSKRTRVLLISYSGQAVHSTQ